LENASRLLLSPLQAGTLDAWRGSVAGALGELLGADKSTFFLPWPGEDPGTSVGSFPLSQEYVRRYVETFETSEFRDDFWMKLRIWGVTARRVLYSPKVYRSWYYRDWVLPVRAYDGLTMGVESGPTRARSFIAFHHDRPSGPRFGGRGVTLLRVLLPSFRAGVGAWHCLAGRTERLGAFIDALSEPVALMGADGRLVHANPAAAGLLAQDPYHPRVAARMSELARRLASTAREQPAENGHPVCPERTVRTRFAHYQLTGFLPPNDLRSDDLILIRLRARRGDGQVASVGAALKQINWGKVSRSYRLTRQEVVVARLLVERRTNREIACALSISPHTALRHTENIRLKLGVRSRREVEDRLLAPRHPDDA